MTFHCFPGLICPSCNLFVLFSQSSRQCGQRYGSSCTLSGFVHTTQFKVNQFFAFRDEAYAARCCHSNSLYRVYNDTYCTYTKRTGVCDSSIKEIQRGISIKTEYVALRICKRLDSYSMVYPRISSSIVARNLRCGHRVASQHSRNLQD